MRQRIRRTVCSVVKRYPEEVVWRGAFLEALYHYGAWISMAVNRWVSVPPRVSCLTVIDVSLTCRLFVNLWFWFWASMVLLLRPPRWWRAWFYVFPPPFAISALRSTFQPFPAGTLSALKSTAQQWFTIIVKRQYSIDLLVWRIRNNLLLFFIPVSILGQRKVASDAMNDLEVSNQFDYHLAAAEESKI